MRLKSLLLASVLVLAIAAHAQYQYTVLHAFGLGNDGAGVFSSLTFDAQGNLYGTTAGGGTFSDGTVFQLSPQAGGEWAESALHNFPSASYDGVSPYGGVIFGPSGNLYGTTQLGGDGLYKHGTVYELSPGLGGWAESVLYSFCSPPGCGDGGVPWAGVIMDKTGNLYGTGGVAFELSPVPDGWVEDVLHNFTGRNGDGYFPQAGPIMDGAGNLYGTTAGGGGGGCGGGCGTVYELQAGDPAVWAPGVVAWKERILHSFGETPGDGAFPGVGQLAIDRFGDLYGTTDVGGNPGYGTVFKLTNVPSATGGAWAEAVLHNFTPGGLGYEPSGGVIIDSAGNLYGTTINGGSALCGCGVVYKLSPQPDGQWQYTLLHTFVGSDGAEPDANLTIGPDGNLYGTASAGGTYGGGVVFQIQIAP
jgi:uncharacterized repeat protein (TIGR03803 family)